MWGRLDGPTIIIEKLRFQNHITRMLPDILQNLKNRLVEPGTLRDKTIENTLM